MGYITIEYDPERKDLPYISRFNRDSHTKITEASTAKKDFEECLQFILDQYQEQIAPHMNPFVVPLTLTVQGPLSTQQHTILENIVMIHNQIPVIYEALRTHHREQITK